MKQAAEEIVQALDMLSDVCGLDRSESSNEPLFLIRAAAFSASNVTEWESIRKDSDEEGALLRHAVADGRNNRGGFGAVYPVKHFLLSSGALMAD